jgi:hypothetical protein
VRKLLLVGLILVGGCVAAASTSTSNPPTSPPTTPWATTATTTATPSTLPPTTTTAPATTMTTLPPGVSLPPSWLGTRPLPLDANGDPLPASTPPELSDRRFATVDILPPPPDKRFHSSIGPVPGDVAARSTWEEGCPVALEDLAYLTVTFRGFDERAHTGELIVSESVATDIVSVFEALYAVDFPIEEMRVTSPADLEAPPTGDGNVTSAFACRPVTGGTGWSEHAYGLAIDINPFHNPYVRGDRVLPELAGDYVDRSRNLPGMIADGDVVTEAFADIGWEWGGRWSSLQDYQHFSQRGR